MPWKVEFSTVRELEKKTFKVFSYSGGALLLGIVLIAVGLPFVGLPLLLIAGVAVVMAIGWISVIGKEPTVRMFCPYCSSTNDVYRSRRGFSCDICARPVLVDEQGQPVMAEPIDTTARFDD